MGTLAVNIDSTEVWSLSGDQGNEWKKAVIDLSAYANTPVSLEFIGTTGTSFQSDMAIDNIFICDGSLGCTDQTACNYDPNATCDNGTCVAAGCGNQYATNYNPTAACLKDELCTYDITFNVDTKGIDVGPNGLYIGGGTVGEPGLGARAVPLTDTGIDNRLTKQYEDE